MGFHMKRLLLVLLPISLFVFSCDDLKEENKPTPVTPSIIDNTIKWTMNEDTDFFRYNLYGSNNSSMENKTLIYETQTRLDTTYTLDSTEYYNSYQIDVMSLNESISSSNILNGFVELWGEFYSIENTTYLNLFNNQLTGSIPSEIGNLTNLTFLYLTNTQLTGSIPSEIGNLTNMEYLYLYNNQLTGSIPPEIGNLTNLTDLRLHDNQLKGEIPESICDLNLDWSSSYYFDITNNQLCPPYPSCIEDYVGEQDTSNCGD